MAGGRVEYGEDSKESIIREAKEETGIQLNNIEIVDLHSRLVNDCDRWFIFGLYFCDDFSFINNKGIKLSHEHTNYKWINIDEIGNYKFRTTIEYVKDKIIEKIKNLN